MYKAWHRWECAFIINDRSKKVRDLESLIQEIENNRLEMERVLAEAKKLRPNGASSKKTERKPQTF